MSPEVSLSQLLDDAPLQVCVGPGGVGKTTISAVLALHAAATGQRSLVLTIDPARRLADALNVPELTNDPVEVPAFAKMHPGGHLYALMLDATATFDHMVAMLVPDERRRAALLENRFYQHLSRSLAGTLEYMAVERLHSLTRSGDYDRVVLDTPPTTNALDFLDAPDRLALFFNQRITRWFMPQAQKKGLTARLLGGAGARVQGLLGRVAGADFVAETASFFATFADLLGDFRQRGEHVGKLLRDPSSAFVVVSSAEPQRVDEALAIDAHLSRVGCAARAFVVNRVDQPFLPDGVDSDDVLQRATDMLGGADQAVRVADFMSRLETLRAARDSAAQRQATEVDRLRRQVAPRPVFTAPRVPASESARASLLAIYVGLFASGATPAASSASTSHTASRD